MRFNSLASMVGGFTVVAVYAWITHGGRDHDTGAKTPGLDSLLVGFEPGTWVTGWDGTLAAYQLGIHIGAYARETA